MINSSSPSKPEISPELVRVHVEIIHRLAAPLAGKGKLVIAGFGEDPDKPHPKTHNPGCPLPPSVVHVEIGDIEIAICTVAKLTVGEHRNVYASLAVFRSDLAPGKKGFEKDIIAVLGLVADFDDADAARWAERLPLPPNLVLETSADRFQAFYLFDKPEAFAAVKTIAARLKAYAACDHGTADLSHVWRIAGTLNWPNAKKVGAGRPREPQTVRVAKGWDGTTISLDALAAVLPASNGKPSAPKKGDSDATCDEGEITDNAPDEGADDTDDADTTTGEPGLPVETIVGLLPPKLRVRIISAPAGDRSRNLFYVVRGLISRKLDDTTIECIIRHYPAGIGAKYAKRTDLDREIRRIRKKSSRRGEAERDATEIDAEEAQQQDAVFALIQKFNAQYAVVNEAGKVWVFEPRVEPVLKRRILDRIGFADLKKMFQNQRLTVTTEGKPITKTTAEWWLDHPQRRQFLGGVVFDPTRSAPTTCWNLWSGFSVPPASGDWSLMQDHIHKVICSGNDAHYEYLLNWSARLFQRPAQPAEAAIVMRGEEGVGKGIFARFIVRAFGQHGIQISSAAHLVGNFNAHLRDCVVLFADEAFYAGDKQHEGRLKALITEECLTIEAKYQNVVSVKNMLHVIMASNSEWVIPASLKARRWFMLDCADTFRGNREYFRDLHHQMEEGGVAAMIYDLLKRDISTFDPRAVPTTKALVEQQVYSLDSLHKWWLAVLARGFLYRSRHGCPAFREWSVFYTTELLFQSYCQWCVDTRANRRQSREELGKFMAKIYVASRPHADHPLSEIDVINVPAGEERGVWLDRNAVVSKSRPTGYIVTELVEARVRFTEICDIPTEWGKAP